MKCYIRNISILLMQILKMLMFSVTPKSQKSISLGQKNVPLGTSYR
jgi:hypothetical protein